MSEHNKRYTPKQFAALVGVSVKTLQRWDREGVLVAGRTLTNRRVYTDEHLRKAQERISKGIADV